MKKINVEKLFKKIRSRKNEMVVLEKNIERLEQKKQMYSFNPWLEEVLPSFQRK